MTINELQHGHGVSFRVPTKDWQTISAILRERLRLAVENDDQRFPNRSDICREALSRGLAAMFSQTPQPPTA
jgi:hypothetical protein